MYLGSQLINRFLPRDSTAATIDGIAVVGIIIVLLNVWYRRLKKREEAADESPVDPTPAIAPRAE